MDMPYLTALFSTQVREATVGPNVELTGSAGHLPPVVAIVMDALESVGGRPQRRSLLQLEIGEDLEDASYELRVGPGVMGANGRALDQHPDQPGANGFASRFFPMVEVDGGGECRDGFDWDGDRNACVPVLDCRTGCAPAVRRSPFCIMSRGNLVAPGRCDILLRKWQAKSAMRQHEAPARSIPTRSKKPAPEKDKPKAQASKEAEKAKG